MIIYPSSMQPSLTANTVQPASLPIGVLLEKRAPFRVPRYQRPYAWDTDNVDDFVDDIRRLLVPPEQRLRDHFFGSMVAVTEQDGSQAEVMSHEVVDGQQRLTTFCLLLAHVMHAAKRLANQYHNIGESMVARRFEILAKETRDRYLYYDFYDLNAGESSSIPRLRLGLADDAKYQALLNLDTFTDVRDSHRRLQATWERLYEFLIKPIEDDHTCASEDKFDRLNGVRDAVLKDAFVIHVVTTDRRGGYRLFSVLNDRGARLTVTDLLRSHTLEQLDKFPQQQEEAAKEWDAILTQSGLEVDDFLRAYYPSLTGKRADRDGLFDNFVDLLFRHPPQDSTTAKAQLDLLATMRNDFTAYTAMRRGFWPYPVMDSPVTAWQRDRLYRLTVLLKHELAMPLLIALYASATEKQFAEVVHKLELFAFRYKNICDGHASAPGNAYYRAAKKLRAKDTSWMNSLVSELRALLANRADDKRFMADLEDLLHYDYSAQRNNIRELLTTLEDYWGWLRNPIGTPKHQASAVIDVGQITLEHIYPQNPQTTDSSLNALTHTLGNLTFWDPHDNKAAGNSPFTDKRLLYKNSRVRMTQALAELPKWDDNAIKARLKSLLEDARKIFVL